MINTKRNILLTTLYGSCDLVGLCLLLATLFLDSYYLYFFSILLIIIPFIFIATKLRKNKKHSIKIFDLLENGYPLDMEHNDEREWRIMLTATYISYRITLATALVSLVILLLLLKLSSLFSAFLLIELAVVVPIITGQWTYLITYYKLDRF